MYCVPECWGENIHIMTTHIKERFKERKVIVTELTNGFISYVPIRLACALVGFETILTWFDPGAGDLIRDVSCEQIEGLIG